MAFSVRALRRCAPTAAAAAVLSGTFLWCSPASDDARSHASCFGRAPGASVASPAFPISPLGRGPLPRITTDDLVRAIGQRDTEHSTGFAKRALDDIIAQEREYRKMWPVPRQDRRAVLPLSAMQALAAATEHLRQAHARAAVDEEKLYQECEVWQDQVYVPVEVEGWRALLNARLLTEDGGRLGDEVMRLMRAQLTHVTRVVRPKQLAQLQAIPIWVEVDNTGHIECCCYNISAQWLTQHGYNPRKVKGIEVTHARRFLSYSIDQPHMLLHELAHGFHGRVLGWDNAYVRQCYDAAVASGKYAKVLRNSAHTCEHYGITDEKEYFAKLTETWLGTSDFYPFVHAELRTHDPSGWHLMNDTWGPPPTHWDYKPPWERDSAQVEAAVAADAPAVAESVAQ